MRKSKTKPSKPKLKITTDSDLNYLSSPLNSAEPLTPMNKSPTFDEVLESAKRKVSRDFVDIRLQNVIEEEIEFDRRALAGSTPYPEEFRQDSTLLEGLDDTDSDEDPWFAQSPPSDITVDDTVEELIRSFRDQRRPPAAEATKKSPFGSAFGLAKSYFRKIWSSAHELHPEFDSASIGTKIMSIAPLAAEFWKGGSRKFQIFVFVARRAGADFVQKIPKTPYGAFDEHSGTVSEAENKHRVTSVYCRDNAEALFLNFDLVFPENFPENLAFFGNFQKIPNS
uniref:Uncharacterized protein n=1 Tax=Bursaphelenchus xylophilus TaxID=6326 RepID=A0A1I7SM52_BURXY